MNPFRIIYQRLHQSTDALMRAVLKNSGWAVAGQAANAGETFIETFMLARFFPLTELGIFFLIAGASELVFGLLDFRTGEAVIKFLPEFDRKKGRQGVASLLRLAFSVDLSVATLGMLIVLGFATVGAQLAGVEPQYATLLTVVAVGTALKFTVRSVGAYLRVTGAFQMSIKLGIAAAVCRLVIMTIMAVSVRTLAGISVGSALADATLFTITLGGCIFALRVYGANPLKASFSEIGRQERREILKFLFSTNIAGTMRSLSTKLDIIVIGALSSTGVVAIYKIASRIAGSLMLFSDPLLIAVYPELSKLHASGETRNVRRLLGTLTKVMAGGAIFIVLTFGIFGKWALRILTHRQYMPAYSTTMYIFAGTSLSMIFFWARPLMLVYGLADRLVLVAFLGLLFQFGLLYGLVPTMGADGGGIALGTSYAVQILFILFLLSRRQVGGER